jgi:hypothetical protein
MREHVIRQVGRKGVVTVKGLACDEFDELAKRVW